MLGERARGWSNQLVAMGPILHSGHLNLAVQFWYLHVCSEEAAPRPCGHPRSAGQRPEGVYLVAELSCLGFVSYWLHVPFCDPGPLPTCLQKSVQYVGVHICYWFVTGGIYSTGFLVDLNTGVCSRKGIPPWIYWPFSWLFGSRGVVTLFVWCWTQDIKVLLWWFSGFLLT